VALKKSLPYPKYIGELQLTIPLFFSADTLTNHHAPPMYSKVCGMKCDVQYL
jgi:hypothetical protein